MGEALHDRNLPGVQESEVKNMTQGRKRRLDDRNLHTPSEKRCRTPISLSLSLSESISGRESATDKNFPKTFNFKNILTSFESDPAGAARREQSDQPSRGVGDDAVFLDNSDSPEAPARNIFVRLHRRCTASLVKDQR